MPGLPYGRGRHPAARLPGADWHLPDDVRRQIQAGLLRREWFVYSLRASTTITTSEPPTDLTLQTRADGPFELCQIQSDSSNFNIQVRDDSQGFQLFSNRVAISAITGSGVTPYWLPVPRLFRARSTIVVSAISTSGTQAFQIYFAGNVLIPTEAGLR